MNKLFRLLWVVLRTRSAPSCPPLGPCRTELRVWPNDLDLFLHVNNGVYFSLCDLARVDLMLRSSSLGIVSGRRRVFMVAAETIQLHRPLRAFQRFHIDTRVLGWDDKAFLVEHRFSRGSTRLGRDGNPAGQTIAICVVEGRVFDQREGQVPPVDVLQRLGITHESPRLPDWVSRWKDDQRALRVAVRHENESGVAHRSSPATRK